MEATRPTLNRCISGPAPAGRVAGAVPSHEGLRQFAADLGLSVPGLRDSWATNAADLTRDVESSLPTYHQALERPVVLEKLFVQAHPSAAQLDANVQQSQSLPFMQRVNGPVAIGAVAAIGTGALVGTLAGLVGDAGFGESGLNVVTFFAAGAGAGLPLGLCAFITANAVANRLDATDRSLSVV